VKPLSVASFTQEDWEIFTAAFRRGPATRWLLHTSQLADRRDAELMFGLTGLACGPQGICVACLWLKGCVINNMTSRIAIRGFEGQHGNPLEGITYFA
jgi:hypothetical protein